MRPERTVGDLREARTEPWPFPWRVTVYLALIRPQRFEWAIEKASELGAAAVVPTLTEHCTHGDGTLSPGRLARWQQIAIEAAEQCGSAFVPEIRPVARFSDTLEAPAGLRLFAWEGADDAVRQPLLDLLPALSRVAAAPPELALFVGPEGGFSPREVQAARDGGCSVVSLGPLTLRAETAAVGALAILAQVRVEFPS